MKINSIIFDMDGVIIDSESQWAIAQITSLKKLGINISENDCEALTRGKRIDQIANIWIRKFHLKTSPEQLANDILYYASKGILVYGKAMPGLYELLNFLKDKNIKLAVATSSSPVIIQAVFDKLQLWDYFILQYSANDEEYGKPHPAVYLRTLQKLGVSAEECIVIEDSVIGLIAAKAANLCTFIINQNCNNEYFAIADERFKTLFDVLKKLENY